MKSINYWIILICILGCQNSENTEYEKIHIAQNDSTFLDFVNKEIITNPDEKKYISDIAKLQSIKLINCNSMHIHYKDSIEGEQIELKITLRKFDVKKHSIKYKEFVDREYKYCELIDGKAPWGGYYGCPETEIDEIVFSINDNQIEIKDELSDVYNFSMCDIDYMKFLNPNPLLKYDKINGVFYLYIKGGQEADRYFGKFVFDDNKFVKRYLLHYGQLSETGSFRENFKGF